jgi:hypothetical protein
MSRRKYEWHPRWLASFQLHTASNSSSVLSLPVLTLIAWSVCGAARLVAVCRHCIIAGGRAIGWQ